jgi:hypothetical protein
MSEKRKKRRSQRDGYQPTVEGLKGKDGKPFVYTSWRDLKPPKWDTAIVPASTPANGKPSQS